MFDIGFSELLLIAVVALVVLGPERLPKVARTLGHLLGRAQRYVADVKAEINKEMALDELRKTQSSVESAAREVQYVMTDEVRKTETAVQQAVEGSSGNAATLPSQAAEQMPAAPSPQLELGLEPPPEKPEHKA